MEIGPQSPGWSNIHCGSAVREDLSCQNIAHCPTLKVALRFWLAPLLISCAVFTGRSVMPTSEEMALAHHWFADNFTNNANPVRPFSFNYGEQSSSNFLSIWKLDASSRALSDQRTEQTLNFTAPDSNVVCRCVAIEYADFPTVEWTVYFKNIGKKDSAMLSDIQALSLKLARDGPEEFLLHHQVGSPANLTDYAPRQSWLPPQGHLHFAGEGGRATSADWSYFNLEWAKQGLIVAVGWPGQWAAEFSRDATNGLSVRAGQELTHLILHPGEEIRTPLTVLQFWVGRDWIDAQNIWRRWMLKYNVPRPGGKPLEPAMFACSSHQFGEMINANVQNQIQFIDRYLEEGLKLDYWWMDAGWYPCAGNWARTGTWEVDPKRFPHGFRPISDHAHSKGMKILVWFEPERVAQETWLMSHHADWVIPSPTTGGQTHNLLNLGNADARHWLTDHVSQLIDEQGIDLYRQDFNIDPLRFWRSQDSPERQGITENRHVTGYLAYWDELLRRHPNVPLDSCASGGRRNDLESMRRAVSRTRSDYLIEPIGEQCHTYGIAFWLPYYGTGFMDVISARDRAKDFENLWNILSEASSMKPITYAQPVMTAHKSRYGTEAYGLDDKYPFRSAMCPSMTHCLDVRKKDLNYELLGKLFSQWRRLSPYLLADYYPLSSYSTGTDVWMAWQFNRPESGDGMIQAFRRHDCPYETATYGLRGLDQTASYEVTDIDSGVARRLSGRELIKQGLTVHVADKPGAVILIYKATK